MPYEPLHHKYRPQTFKDLVGQETIALTLSNALQQEKIAPAYLFTGPRGTGKTSSARILAKSLNCLNSPQPTPNPCGKCEACVAITKGSALDVMEIDAASNTGVDNIREIIERSRFAPVQCRYKIYAIDECHMLSTAAFNALLKTLEEPPPKVVFILATTDPQRVLSTIISRCQRFDYRRIPLPEMIGHLKYIAGAENIAIVDEAIALISQIANGGLRDAESLLDQLSLIPEEISVAKVWDLVGAVPEQDLLILLQAVRNNDSLGILQQCRSLLDRGREPMIVLQNLASFYLNLLIAKTAPQRPDMVAVTEACWQELCTEAKNWDTALILQGQQRLKEAETQLKHTTQPRLWLEVTLLGLLTDAESNIPRTTTTKPAAVNQGNQGNQSQPDAAPVQIAAHQQQIKPPDQIEHQAPAQVSLQDSPKVNAVSPNNVAVQTPTQPQKSAAAASINSADVEPELKSNAKPSQQSVSATVAVNPTPVDSKIVHHDLPNGASHAGLNAKSKADAVPAIASPRQEREHRFTSGSQTANNNIVKNNAANNKETWDKVVSCLQPPTTQALLKQQCYLIEFDGASAIVGISSAKLQKLNQGKVPNIEAAFAQVCQRKIKVQLEVAAVNNGSGAKNSGENSAPSLANGAAAISHQIPQAIANINTSTETKLPHSSETGLVASKQQEPSVPSSVQYSETVKPQTDEEIATSTPAVHPSPPASEQVPRAATTSSLVTETKITAPTVPNEQQSKTHTELEDTESNYGSSDLQQAIASLTQSFEGELVQMDNTQDDELSESEEILANSEPAPTTAVDSQGEDSLHDRPNVEDYDDDW